MFEARKDAGNVVESLYFHRSKLLDVRKRILHSNIEETERLELADQILFAMDAIDHAAIRVRALGECASIFESALHTPIFRPFF